MIRWWHFFTLLFTIQTCSDHLPISRLPTNHLSIVAFTPTVLPAQQENSIFKYGVASGDPLPDAIIIWTMLDDKAAQSDSLVEWQLSLDDSFTNIVQSDTSIAFTQHHRRIKEDIVGLEPATTYYYRFRNGTEWSPTGRSRTSPAPMDDTPVQLAVVSCNAYEWGYFNAFENLTEYTDLDAIIHLGDYIYEYATAAYGDTTIGRIHEPRHEVITTEDYHQRYAQYRRDPQLQAAHAAHPFICVWDDHEVANNSYGEGAENHDTATEGDYLTRVSAAKNVYYDWMPIREREDGRLYRSFRMGSNVSLHMLDERLAGRTAPAEGFGEGELQDSTRHMLGEDQFRWLCEKLRTSDSQWNLIGNQVLFAKLDLANILPQYAVNLDAWDGYRYDKMRLLDSMRLNGDPNVVFLTGDTHCSWYFDLEEKFDNGVPLARELATPSISSANYDEFISGWDTLAVARHRLFRDNDHLNYTNLTDHGYLLLDVRPNKITAAFHYLRDIRQPKLDERPVKTFTLPYVDQPAR